MKTDFVMFCCSLQVGMWPSISRAMLTSADGNQNYGKLPGTALTWLGGFDAVGTAPPRCNWVCTPRFANQSLTRCYKIQPG